MRSAKFDTRRTNDLLKLLSSLREIHRELLSVIESKTQAMREADRDALRDATQREKQLVETIKEREGLRRQLMELIGAQLKIPAGKARVMKSSELAARLPQPWRDRLLSGAKELREVMAEVARMNRVSGGIAAAIVWHLQSVFASVMTPGRSVGYSGCGKTVSAGGACIIETVG